jgi:hypothetical protein
VLFGDQLAQLLGQENLATKILYVALAAAAVTVFAAGMRRRFISR